MGCLFHTLHVRARGGTPTACGSTGTSSVPVRPKADTLADGTMGQEEGHAPGQLYPPQRPAPGLGCLTPLHPVVGQPAGRREDSDAAVMATEALKMKGREGKRHSLQHVSMATSIFKGLYKKMKLKKKKEEVSVEVGTSAS